MKASELRSGNFIKLFKNGKPHLEWYELDSHDIYKLDESNCEDVEPIPLTEEWLLKIGFKYYKDGIYQFWSKYVGIFQVMNCSDNNGFGIRIWLNGTFGRTIYFLHDFQNLFFSLHGEELELK